MLVHSYAIICYRNTYNFLSLSLSNLYCLFFKINSNFSRTSLDCIINDFS